MSSSSLLAGKDGSETYRRDYRAVDTELGVARHMSKFSRLISIFYGNGIFSSSGTSLPHGQCELQTVKAAPGGSLMWENVRGISSSAPRETFAIRQFILLAALKTPAVYSVKLSFLVLPNLYDRCNEEWRFLVSN